MGEVPAGSHVPPEAVAALLARTGGVVECRVAGSSMGATLPHGSRIRVRFAPGDSVRPDDVVAFTAAGGITVHRVVGRGRVGRARNLVLTRGDGTLLVDHPVPVDAILGVAREYERDGQWHPVPSLVATGPGRVARATIVWPVWLALHVGRQAAMALTVLGFSLRWVWNRTRTGRARP